ncbi:hypothetical protein Nmel_011154 [Mimus melanotis]
MDGTTPAVLEGPDWVNWVGDKASAVCELYCRKDTTFHPKDFQIVAGVAEDADTSRDPERGGCALNMASWRVSCCKDTGKPKQPALIQTPTAALLGLFVGMQQDGSSIPVTPEGFFRTRSGPAVGADVNAQGRVMGLCHQWEWCGKHHSDRNEAGRGVRSWPALRIEARKGFPGLHRKDFLHEITTLSSSAGSASLLGTKAKLQVKNGGTRVPPRHSNPIRNIECLPAQGIFPPEQCLWEELVTEAA